MRLPDSVEHSLQLFAAIAGQKSLTQPTAKYKRGPLYELIKKIKNNLLRHSGDIIGDCYRDYQKALGIVLTPAHIRELCCLIADLNLNSRVLDMCAGTGGFLVSAINHMASRVVPDSELAL